MPLTQTPDVNVLVAASRNDHPHYLVASEWIGSAIADCAKGGRLLLLPMVAAGFLRLVTHPRVFEQPTPSGQAIDFVEALLAVPGVSMPELGPEWAAFAQLCRNSGVTGNAVPDAWIATASTVAGGHLVSFDRGFSALLDRRHWTLLSPRP